MHDITEGNLFGNLTLKVSAGSAVFTTLKVRNIIGRSSFLLKFADNSAKQITTSSVALSIDPYQLVVSTQPALMTRIGDPLGPVRVLLQDTDANNVTVITDPDGAMASYLAVTVTPGLLHWGQDVTAALDGAVAYDVQSFYADFDTMVVARDAGSGLHVYFNLTVSGKVLTVKSSELTVLPAELVSISAGAQSGVLNSPAQVSSVQDSVVTTITISLRNSTLPPIGTVAFTKQDAMYITAKLVRNASNLPSCASLNPAYNASNEVDYTNTTSPCLGGRTKTLAEGGTVVFTDLVVRNTAGSGFTLRFDVAGAGSLLDPALTSPFTVFPGDLKIVQVRTLPCSPTHDLCVNKKTLGACVQASAEACVLETRQPHANSWSEQHRYVVCCVAH